jgi:thiosulfate/3-mercaptopyruvate sulfurtransferase
MLVSTAQLEEKLNDRSWVIFDCRHDLSDHTKGERAYAEGHIPGAHFAKMESDLSGEKTGRNGRHPLPSPYAFTSFLACHGVGPDSTIVAYDDMGGQFAARLWWMARWVGLTDVHLLDGGLTKWLAEGRGLSGAVSQPRATALAGHANPRIMISAEELLPRLGNADWLLLDARAPERYRGDVEPMDPVAGHIPGAVNRFHKENYNADLTFKSPDTLREEFVAMLKGRPADRVVHQCGSGVTACVNVFAMELAGLSGSVLYPGSWSEWVSDAARPVVMREDFAQ